MSAYRLSYERLIAYAAAELNADEAACVEQHIHQCVTCATTLKCFRFVQAIICTDDTQYPPAATLARAQALFACPRLMLPRNWLGMN